MGDLFEILKKIASYILKLRFIIRFSRRYPRAYWFIINRFTIESFRGLPLTLLTILFLFNVFLFSEISDKVINSDKVIFIDDFVARLFYKVRTEWLARLFYSITLFCHPIVISIIAIAASIFFLIKKHSVRVLAILISIIGSAVSIYFGKHVFHLERPYSMSWYKEPLFSFPSGHATAAVAFYGLLFYLWARSSYSVKARSFITFFGIILIGAIGLSRLYLVVHFVSDVLAGYFLGLLWLILCISIIEWKK